MYPAAVGDRWKKVDMLLPVQIELKTNRELEVPRQTESLALLHYGAFP